MVKHEVLKKSTKPALENPKEGSIAKTILANAGLLEVEVKDRVKYMNGRQKIPRIQRVFDWLRIVKKRMIAVIVTITLYRVIRSLISVILSLILTPARKRRRAKKNGRTR